jgi:uncharacterized DUF497 family protein
VRATPKKAWQTDKSIKRRGVEFEWDSQKAAANVRKHGVTFDEAATVFLDELAVSGTVPDHSVGEARYIKFG